MADCRESDRLEVHGYADELNARISHLKRYQPRFFELPFEAQPGSESMLTALGVARKLDSGEFKTLPADAPVDFVAPNLRAPLRSADGALKQRTWEIRAGAGRAGQSSFRKSVSCGKPQARTVLESGL